MARRRAGPAPRPGVPRHVAGLSRRKARAVIDLGGVFVDRDARQGRGPDRARRAGDRGQRRRRARSRRAAARAARSCSPIDARDRRRQAGGPRHRADARRAIAAICSTSSAASSARSTSSTGSICRPAGCSCSRARATRTSSSATLFKVHDIEREYRAVAIGDGRPPRRSIVRSTASARSPTSSVIEPLAGATLVSARLETGRTHQIRLHLAGLGTPIAGDPQHGGETEPHVRAARAAPRAARRGARVRPPGDRRAGAVRVRAARRARGVDRPAARVIDSTAWNVHALTTAARPASSSNTPVIAGSCASAFHASSDAARDHDREIPARARCRRPGARRRRPRPRRSSWARSISASSARVPTSSSRSFTKQNRWITGSSVPSRSRRREAGEQVGRRNRGRRIPARHAGEQRDVEPGGARAGDVGLELIADHHEPRCDAELALAPRANRCGAGLPRRSNTSAAVGEPPGERGLDQQRHRARR